MLLHPATRLISLILIAILSCSPLASAQTSTPAPSSVPLVPPRPSRNPKRASAPIDDYVPCLFDDIEVYQNRTLDVPGNPAEPKAGDLFSYDAANTIARGVKHYLLNNVLPPTSQEGKKTTTEQNKQQQKQSQALLSATQALLDKKITPEIFLGQTLDKVARLVEDVIGKVTTQDVDDASKKILSAAYTKPGLSAETLATEVSQQEANLLSALQNAAKNSGAIATAAAPPVGAVRTPPRRRRLLIFRYAVERDQ